MPAQSNSVRALLRPAAATWAHGRRQFSRELHPADRPTRLCTGGWRGPSPWHLLPRAHRWGTADTCGRQSRPCGCTLQGGGCEPYFVVKVTNGVLKDFTVFDYRLHVPKKKVWSLPGGRETCWTGEGWPRRSVWSILVLPCAVLVLQIPPFKKSEHTMTMDLTAHNLIIRNNAFFEWFDYDRGKADQKVRALQGILVPLQGILARCRGLLTCDVLESVSFRFRADVPLLRPHRLHRAGLPVFDEGVA